MSRTYIEQRTPSDWSVVDEPDTYDWETTTRVVWAYTPRPRLRVAVRPREEPKLFGSEVPRYLTERRNHLGSETFTHPSSGFLPHVDLAEQLMRGIHGVTATDLQIQTGIGSAAASAIGKRIREWTDLRDLCHRGTDFTGIDGVGAVSNEKLVAATADAFLDREPVDVATNPEEGSEPHHTAAYVALPHVDGWKVRKEWRCPDGRVGSWVMLPTEDPRGELYESLDAARTAAEMFAADRAGDLDDVAVSDDDAFEAVAEDHETAEVVQMDLSGWA